MLLRLGSFEDKSDYVAVQKETFSKIDLDKESLFFDQKIKQNEIFIVENDGIYVGIFVLVIIL